MSAQPGFSALEASITNAPVGRRPTSVKANAVFHHANPEDMNVNELEFTYTSPFTVLGGPPPSLHHAFAAAQAEKHLANEMNFTGNGSKVDVFEINSERQGWRELNDLQLVQTLKESHTSPSLTVYFTTLSPATDSSFGASSSLSHEGVDAMISILGINQVFALNILGRPDYWAPQSMTHKSVDGIFETFGMAHGGIASFSVSHPLTEVSLQHPRWNLQVQGSPISVLMKHNFVTKSTTYIIAHTVNDTIVSCLRALLEVQLQQCISRKDNSFLLGDPLEIHSLVCSISMEASKFHVKRFQRFMWQQFKKVDDHFSGEPLKERHGLDALTKELQVVSYNADSHIANASIASINAKTLKRAHLEFDRQATVCYGYANTIQQQRTADALDYVVDSMEKQKMWFLNYKNRKDNTASLVFNLVTQQDAANNFSIASDMKKDSTSMNAIAALTMIFLPGTFTATVLGAGVFSALANASNGVHVGGLWWFWVAVTLPLTALTILSWWLYQKFRARTAKPMTADTHVEEEEGEKMVSSVKMSWVEGLGVRARELLSVRRHRGKSGMNDEEKMVETPLKQFGPSFTLPAQVQPPQEDLFSVPADVKTPFHFSAEYISEMPTPASMESRTPAVT